ncbi:MAG: alkylhalidase, partial [Chthoniobacteraceae bacterium]
YDPKFSFRDVVMRHPEAADQITDCLSGDVSKDYSQLWDWIRECVPLPDELQFGRPLAAA